MDLSPLSLATVLAILLSLVEFSGPIQFGRSFGGHNELYQMFPSLFPTRNITKSRNENMVNLINNEQIQNLLKVMQENARKEVKSTGSLTTRTKQQLSKPRPVQATHKTRNNDEELQHLVQLITNRIPNSNRRQQGWGATPPKRKTNPSPTPPPILLENLEIFRIPSEILMQQLTSTTTPSPSTKKPKKYLTFDKILFPEDMPVSSNPSPPTKFAILKLKATDPDNTSRKKNKYPPGIDSSLEIIRAINKDDEYILQDWQPERTTTLAPDLVLQLTPRVTSAPSLQPKNDSRSIVIVKSIEIEPTSLRSSTPASPASVYYNPHNGFHFPNGTKATMEEALGLPGPEVKVLQPGRSENNGWDSGSKQPPPPYFRPPLPPLSDGDRPTPSYMPIPVEFKPPHPTGGPPPPGWNPKQSAPRPIANARYYSVNKQGWGSNASPLKRGLPPPAPRQPEAVWTSYPPPQEAQMRGENSYNNAPPQQGGNSWNGQSNSQQPGPGRPPMPPSNQQPQNPQNGYNGGPSQQPMPQNGYGGGPSQPPMQQNGYNGGLSQQPMQQNGYHGGPPQPSMQQNGYNGGSSQPPMQQNGWNQQNNMPQQVSGYQGPQGWNFMNNNPSANPMSNAPQDGYTQNQPAMPFGSSDWVPPMPGNFEQSNGGYHGKPFQQPFGMQQNGGPSPSLAFTWDQNNRGQGYQSQPPSQEDHFPDPYFQIQNEYGQEGSDDESHYYGNYSPGKPQAYQSEYPQYQKGKGDKSKAKGHKSKGKGKYKKSKGKKPTTTPGWTEGGYEKGEENEGWNSPGWGEEEEGESWGWGDKEEEEDDKKAKKKKKKGEWLNKIKQVFNKHKEKMKKEKEKHEEKLEEWQATGSDYADHYKTKAAEWWEKTKTKVHDHFSDKKASKGWKSKPSFYSITQKVYGITISVLALVAFFSYIVALLFQTAITTLSAPLLEGIIGLAMGDGGAALFQALLGFQPGGRSLSDSCSEKDAMLDELECKVTVAFTAVRKFSTYLGK